MNRIFNRIFEWITKDKKRTTKVIGAIIVVGIIVFVVCAINIYNIYKKDPTTTGIILSVIASLAGCMLTANNVGKIKGYNHVLKKGIYLNEYDFTPYVLISLGIIVSVFSLVFLIIALIITEFNTFSALGVTLVTGLLGYLLNIYGLHVENNLLNKLNKSNT